MLGADTAYSFVTHAEGNLGEERLASDVSAGEEQTKVAEVVVDSVHDKIVSEKSARRWLEEGREGCIPAHALAGGAGDVALGV